MYIDMRDIYIDTVKSLSQAVEAKDPYTNGHSRRVGEYACKLAERLGLSPKKVENLKIAAILHDIGKIGIDESILNKPGRLTEEEFEKIKQHPEIGVKIIKDIDFLKDASEIILSHHERYDGTGYPEGRKHKDIILEAQILSIADVFDALTSERPYRNAMTVEEALDIIEKGKGIQFDSKLADAFIKMVKDDKEMKKVAG
jgi:putative nucleotidyltransferase with HDIG domain